MSNFLVVLDINNTLLSKIKKYDRSTFNLIKTEDLYDIGHYYLLKRPFTDLFIRFLDSHNLDYVIWSTALRKNVEKMLKYLKKIGYNYLGYLGQEECEEGTNQLMKAKRHVKNLEIVSSKYQRKLNECILIDDNIEKTVVGQNYIKIKEINVLEEDQELIRVGYELDKFIKCTKDCEIKKVHKESL